MVHETDHKFGGWEDPNNQFPPTPLNELELFLNEVQEQVDEVQNSTFFPSQHRFVPTHRRGRRRVPWDGWYHHNVDTMRILNAQLNVSPVERQLQRDLQREIREANNQIEINLSQRIERLNNAIANTERMHSSLRTRGDMNRLRRRRHSLRSELLRFRNSL